ncbi:MAG: hypothetical protein M1823_000397 [Watsoniomyces obsoletus]|nr:MAG: hypothetical protein M1823_000397 [Watsoniomyces obsoletus]
MDPQKSAGANTAAGQQPAATSRQKPVYDTRNGGHYGASAALSAQGHGTASDTYAGTWANVNQGLQGNYRDILTTYWQQTIDSLENETHDYKQQPLPLARIKKVMKADPEVKMISAEAPILFAKGCDIFITELTMRAWIHAEENKRRTLQRSDIAAALAKSDMFDFLIDIVPREEAVAHSKRNAGGGGGGGGHSAGGVGSSSATAGGSGTHHQQHPHPAGSASTSSGITQQPQGGGGSSVSAPSAPPPTQQSQQQHHQPSQPRQPHQHHMAPPPPGEYSLRPPHGLPTEQDYRSQQQAGNMYAAAAAAGGGPVHASSSSAAAAAAAAAVAANAYAQPQPHIPSTRHQHQHQHQHHTQAGGSHPHPPPPQSASSSSHPHHQHHHHPGAPPQQQHQQQQQQQHPGQAQGGQGQGQGQGQMYPEMEPMYGYPGMPPQGVRIRNF